MRIKTRGDEVDITLGTRFVEVYAGSKYGPVAYMEAISEPQATENHITWIAINIETDEEIFYRVPLSDWQYSPVLCLPDSETFVEKIKPNVKCPYNMFAETDLNRFLEAQDSRYNGYEVTLQNIQKGIIIQDEIWYIFPRLRDEVRRSFIFRPSSRELYYGITDMDETLRYLEHPILGKRLRIISRALLDNCNGDIPYYIHSCMTMFDFLSPNDIFNEVINVFFQGKRRNMTLKIMQKNNSML